MRRNENIERNRNKGNRNGVVSDVTSPVVRIPEKKYSSFCYTVRSWFSPRRVIQFNEDTCHQHHHKDQHEEGDDFGEEIEVALRFDVRAVSVSILSRPVAVLVGHQFGERQPLRQGQDGTGWLAVLLAVRRIIANTEMIVDHVNEVARFDEAAPIHGRDRMRMAHIRRTGQTNVRAASCR